MTKYNFFIAHFFLSLVSLAQSTPSPPKDGYDYIIIGGGTTGLVLANRLSENAETSVAVVEAGESVLQNENVTQIQNFFASLGSDIDWQYESQPQVFAGNETKTYNSGKALGGTSTINGATYVRAQKAQIDAWEVLGNEGWNWDVLFPYYLKSEAFLTPNATLAERGVSFDPDVHGYDGPLDVGWSNYTMAGDAHEVLNQTYMNLSLPYNRDSNDGALRGFTLFPSTVDGIRNVRADAARSYYAPVSERRNLHVFTGTLAEKLEWTEDDVSSLAEASGVVVRSTSGGDPYALSAKREVILSAGSLKSPGILESSGVGNPAILAKHDIPCKVNLPSVGENLQDQANTPLVAAANTTYTGYTPFAAFLTAHDLFGPNTSAVATHLRSQLPAYAAQIAAQNPAAPSPETIHAQLSIQADLIFNHSVPVAEILLAPSQAALAAPLWGMLPFSRGSVHLGSPNASTPPLINPNFFMLDWDLQLQTATAKHARRVFSTPPLAALVDAPASPDLETVPADAGPETWKPWFQETCPFSPSHALPNSPSETQSVETR
ncbi:hypothetical protein MBLNU230_g3185t1 [Neophaeotheca triangularis]